jgi:hypothetical protein
VVLEPTREPFVQLGPPRFRQRVVRRVAHQQVTKAKAVLAWDLSPVRCDQLLADEARQLRRHLRLVGDEGLHRAAVKDLPFDGAALEHGSLGALEAVEPRGQQGLERGRDDRLAVARHRKHLADEEWVAAGRAGDPLAQRAGDSAGNQSLDVRVG